jgi:hypothetical protein
LSILDAWREAADLCGYKYPHFTSLYAGLRSEHSLGRILRAKRRLTISPTDCAVLKSWQRSHNRRKWEVSVALLGLSSGHTTAAICQKLARARRTVEKWCATNEPSAAGVYRRDRCQHQHGAAQRPMSTGNSIDRSRTARSLEDHHLRSRTSRPLRSRSDG